MSLVIMLKAVIGDIIGDITTDITTDIPMTPYMAHINYSLIAYNQWICISDSCLSVFQVPS